MSHAFDGEVADHRPPVSAFGFDLGALEGDGWILLDLEEGRRPQVIVALLIVRPNAGGVDRHLDLRPFGLIGIELSRCRQLGEVTADGHHAQMLGRELNLGMKRIEFPGSHRHASSKSGSQSNLLLAAYFLQVAMVITIRQLE